MLMPKRTKFRKTTRGRMTGVATRGNTIAFGEYALQALEPCWLNSRQIETCRKTINGYIKRGGKVWIRVFPDKPVTKRAAESRMGAGKGTPEFWVAVVKPGTIIFELAGTTPEIAQEAFRRAQYKLPIATKFIKLEGPNNG